MVQDMTRGNIRKQIISFAIPLLIGNIFQQLYSMVDAIIVGRFVGINALAAVGSTGAISFLIIGFVQGVSSGFSIVTSQRFGAHDKDGVKESIVTSAILCVIIIIVTTAVSILTARPLLVIMNTPKNIIDDAALFIKIIYAGIFATVYYNMVSSILRALGDSKTPLYFLIFASVLNVILDLIFIGRFKMGVRGAGCSTVLSQLASAVLCNIYSVKHFDVMRLKKSDFCWNTHSVIVHLGIGIPMALQFSITAIGTMVLQSAFNAFGSTVVAAYTAASKVESLVTQPFQALGLTLATFCGQNLGAGKKDRIRAGMKEGTIMCMAACGLAIIIDVFGGKYFTILFVGGNNADVIKYSQTYLYITAIFYPSLGLLFIYRNALQGIGESLIPMLGGVGELTARVFACIVFPPLLGYIGVCFASPMAWVTTSMILLVKYVTMVKHWQKCS